MKLGVCKILNKSVCYVDVFIKKSVVFSVIFQNTAIKNNFTDFLKSCVGGMDPVPKLYIIQIGDELASTKYVGMKQKLGQKLGIEVVWHKFNDNVDIFELVKVVEEVRANNFGLIFQLPVPIKFKDLVYQTPIYSDVDLLGVDSDKLWEQGFLPPTIGAIDLVLKKMMQNSNRYDENFIEYIEEKNEEMFVGKSVAIIGQGVLVGGPLLRYFKERQATIISINKFTLNPAKLCRQADIVISAAGKPNLVDRSWLKPRSILLDAATSEDNGSLAGDVDRGNIQKSVLLSPSPGGIGGLTVMYLFYNLLKLHLKRI